MNIRIDYSIKASRTVEGFFQHHCERNLLYNGITSTTCKAFGLNGAFVKGGAVAAKAGDEWETEVIEHKIPKGYLKFRMADKKYGKFDEASMEDLFVSTSSEVETDKQTRYIYQGLLIETDTFRKMCYKELPKSWYNNTDPYLYVHMARTYPDLIRLSWDDEKNKVIVSVVDCKLAEKMQLKHKAQISLYVRLLKCMFEEYQSKGILANTVVDTETAYLWNRGQETERPFSVTDIDPFIDDFFMGSLPAVLQKVYNCVRDGKQKELKSSLYICTSQTCEWCENFHQCRREHEEKGSISLLPYISQYAQEHVRAIGAPDTVSGIMEYIIDPANRERLTGNHSWEKILEDESVLELHEQARPYGDVLPEYRWKANARSYILPSWQSNTLILTAQKDVGTGYVYALGFYSNERSTSVGADGKIRSQYRPYYDIFVSERPTEDAYLENAAHFISALIEKLNQLKDMKVHNTNAALIPASFQAYVMDSYELKNLEDMLYDLIDRETLDEAVRWDAISLLLWIQGDRIVSNSDFQPEKEIDHPILVISQSIRSLVFLPLTIAYDIRGIKQTLKVFIENQYLFRKEDNSFFEAISNAIPSEVINDIWNGKKNVTIESMRKHILKRFVYSIGILTKLQKEGRERRALVNGAGRLEMPGRQTISPVLLAKWDFENRNEALLAYHMIRSERMKDIGAALNEGGIIEGRLLQAEDRRDGSYINTFIKLEFDTLGDYRAARWFSAIAVKADDEGLNALYSYRDIEYAKSLFNGSGHGDSISVICFPELSAENGRMIMKGQVCGTPAFKNKLKQAYNAHRPMRLYVCERYTDINSSKTSDELINLGRHTILTGETHRLLLPDRLNKPTGDIYKNDCEALDNYSKMDGKRFTESQKKAFIHLYENTLTVLQGPPGTGKTDFIARTVITLCRFFRSKRGRNLRVLVSANSHPAIENVLFGVLNKFAAEDNDIDVIKAGRFDNGADIMTVNGHRLPKADEEFIVLNYLRQPQKPVIVGATNWSCRYIKDFSGTFDVIIFDEASQVRVMDAMIGLMRSTEETRFLLVGDDDQLSPIIHGNYRKEPGVPYDYGSVFSFYKDRCNDNGCSFMLEENFRMNDMLVRYSAEKIYSDKYRAFNAEIGTRHLEYTECEASEIIRYILDDLHYTEEDYWPLVFCRISGGSANEQETAERRLVTELTACMRRAVGDGLDDEQFWRDSSGDGVFGIISPHHKHIEKLKDDISSITGMDRDVLYIGTVDKLQGQQREAVVVSYGVTDVEQAAIEGEFLFSRNRLNVSLTRGKCKTVVFFSEVLTHCPVEVFMSEDEDIQKGASFVCGLYDFMKHEEYDTRVSGRTFTLATADSGTVTVEILRKRVVTEKCDSSAQ